MERSYNCLKVLNIYEFHNYMCAKWMWLIKFYHFLLMWMKRFYWYLDVRKVLITLSIVTIAVLAILPFVTEKRVRYLPCQVHPSAHNPSRFNQDNSGPPPYYEEIIPNTVHFYRTGKDVYSINFIDALCLYSAFRVAEPGKIMIHTDDVWAVSRSFTDTAYGRRLMQVPGFKSVLDIQYWPIPKHVFGIEFNSLHRSRHINDVTRLRILRKYGGIFLDNHSFLIKNPQLLRKYEMVMFETKETLSNNLIIAHRDARMLDLWLKSYHNYDPIMEVHHHSPFVKSLFLQKTTLYHKREHAIQESNVNFLNRKNELPIKDYDNNCYMIYLNSSRFADLGYGDDNLEFGTDYLINFVEKHIFSKAVK